MSPWTWVLTALCVCGVLLAAASLVIAALAAAALSKRVKALQQTPLTLSVQSLQIQSERLARISTQAQPLVERAGSALLSIQESLETLKGLGARDALASTGAELQTLGRELR